MLTTRRTLQNSVVVSILGGLLWSIYGGIYWHSIANGATIGFVVLFLVSVILFAVLRGNPLLDREVVSSKVQAIICIAGGVVLGGTVIYLLHT